jgi:beta-fructofuranosidase
MNDPNGLVHWNGTHHVFHQSDPDSLWFGTMSWGHVSSTDLLHWRRDEPALVPSQPPDRDGCWTGCVVDVDGVATAIYTGVVALGDDHWTQSVCLATATDPGLRSWRKHPGNPVEVEPPGFPVTVFRDPYVWRDGSGWVMLLGSALPSGEGAILCYRSPDLLRWSYEGVAVRGSELPQGLWTGTVWECPALLRVSEDRHLLVFSVSDPSKTPHLYYPVAVTGWFDGTRFRPQTMARFDHGHDCYAPAVETTAGRFLAYGWSWEGLTEQGRAEQGWAGCLTLPREIGFRDGQVTYRLAADLTSLRSGHWGARDLRLATGEPGLEHTVGSRTAEIRLVIELDADGGFDLVFFSSPDGQEQTVVRYRAAGASLEFDRDRSSLWPETVGGVSQAHYPLPATGIMELTLVLDHSVAELFAGDSVVMTERVYPQRTDSTAVRLNAAGRGATVRSFDVWELGLAADGGTGDANHRLSLPAADSAMGGRE